MNCFCRLLLASALGAAVLTSSEAFGQPPDYFVPPPRENIAPPDAEPLPPEISSIIEPEARLKVIQRRSQLIVAKTGIVRTAIADPGIADIVQFSPNEVSIIGIGTGTTTLTFWFENNPDPLVYLLEVIRDPSLEDRQRTDYGRLERKLALIFPNSKVYLIPLSGKIIVRGQARDSEEAARILQLVRGEVINQNGSLAGPQAALPGGLGPDQNVVGGGINGFSATDLASSYIVDMLEVPGEFQLSLRVRFAELKREQLRRMGVNFSFLANGRHFFSSVMGGGAGSLTGLFEAGDISFLLDWLASNGTAKILSEPNISVMSGQTANFLSGGEFPVPTIAGIGGAQGQTTYFRGFGVSLTVIPTVINHDLIQLQITPEFSALNSGNGAGGIPGTNVRRIQTTVRLREGQTIALAGLLDSQSSTEVTRVPLLGEIPYIGTLFNAKKATLDETELLILVSPEIIRPMDADEVPPVPGHEVTHPNDCDLYWYNRTEGNPDQGYYQLPPYGHNGGVGQEVGYTQFNPAPAQTNYTPGLGQGPFSPAVQAGGLSNLTVPGGATMPPGQYSMPPAGGRYPGMTPGMAPGTAPGTAPGMMPMGRGPVPQSAGRLGPLQPVPARQPTPAVTPGQNATRPTTTREQAYGPRLNYPSSIQRTAGYSNGRY